MRAGTLDRRIVIQQRSFTKETSGEEIESWATWKTVWAAWKPEKGAEDFQSDQRVATQKGTFEIRYLAGVDPAKHRVLFEGKLYEIEDVSEPERKVALVLTVHTFNAKSGS